LPARRPNDIPDKKYPHEVVVSPQSSVLSAGFRV
jgi:hypothetical protein